MDNDAHRGLSEPHAPARSLRLSCGRRLAYCSFGDSDGHPVFYFHGWPSSRLEAVLLHEAARRNRVRLIAVDRPGIGRSDPAPGQTLLEWPKDVAALADGLELDRFGIVAWSGGAPWAMACGFALAERLTAVLSVSGVGPVDWPGAKHHLSHADRSAAHMARNAPLLLRLWLGLAATTLKWFPRAAHRALRGWFCPTDRLLLDRPGVAEQLAASFSEALRSGTAGLAHDAATVFGEWGFDLRELRHPIHIWHGTEDRSVQHAFGQHFAASLPEARFRSFDGEGHLLIIAHADEIMRLASEQS